MRDSRFLIIWVNRFQIFQELNKRLNEVLPQPKALVLTLGHSLPSKGCFGTCRGTTKIQGGKSGIL